MNQNPNRRGEGPSNVRRGASRVPGGGMDPRQRERMEEARRQRAARERARAEYERRLRLEEQKRRRAALRRARQVMLIAVIVVVCSGIIAAAVIVMDIAFRGDVEKNIFKYQLANNKVRKLSYDSVVTNGEMYLNFSEIAKEFSFSVTGDADAWKFIARDDYTEYAVFSPDSSEVTINGEKTRLSAPTFVKKQNLYVPMSFISDYMSGLVLTYDEKTHTITLKADTGDSAEEIGFRLKDSSPLDPIQEEGAVGTVDLGFQMDLSSYEMYMNPTDRDVYCFLVNASHTLSSDFVPSDLTNLVDTRKDGRAIQQMSLNAAKSLEAFLIEARANGFSDITVTSAYRSYAYQEELFNNYVKGEMERDASLTEEQAREIVRTYSSVPGTSEHQSGLCVDMHNMASAQTAFGVTAAAKWLEENAYKFGFILRYPKDKSDITNIIYEPWHFRYVGRYHATRMHQTGLCLEEYVPTLQS